MTGVLHPHSRRLEFHPRVHFLIPGGAIDQHHRFWKRKDWKFLFPQAGVESQAPWSYHGSMSEERSNPPPPPGFKGEDTIVYPPRVLEVLLKKAAIDESFREDLILRRAAVADEQGLPIADEERAMLAAVPENQLRMMIDRIPVHSSERKGLSLGCLVALLAGGILGVVAIPNCRKARGHTADSPKVCSRNLLEVEAAVELHNMAASGPADLITEINRDNAERIYQELLDKGYLKMGISSARCPLCQEFYLGRDLTGNGRLTCKIHDVLY